MNPNSQRLVIIPCHDEAATVGNLVAKVRALSIPVLVIDDASTDGTSNVVTRAGAEVIRLEKRSGKGAALRTGFNYGLENGFETAITLDGDGQHRPEEIEKFAKEFENSEAEMIVGNRMDDLSTMPRIRRGTNKLMSWVLSQKAGRHFSDSQCGFRWIKLTPEFVDGLQTSHFEIESEMLVLATKLHWRVRFVPITCVYRESHSSKIRPFLDTFRWLRWLWNARNDLSAQNPFAPTPTSVTAMPSNRQVYSR